MIERFTDLAANERTFLAWVRTAIAIIALGFVVEKFELFLHYMAGGQKGAKAPVPSQVSAAEAIGLLLVALGILIIAVAAFRFLSFRKRLHDPEPEPDHVRRLDRLLIFLLILLVGFVIAYFTHSLGRVIIGW